MRGKAGVQRAASPLPGDGVSPLFSSLQGGWGKKRERESPARLGLARSWALGGGGWIASPADEEVGQSCAYMKETNSVSFWVLPFASFST